MVCNCFTKKLAYSILCGLAGLCSLSGCAQHNYKAEADEDVYKIINQKWQKEFGSLVNFKISDTEPSPNDIQIEKAIPSSGVLTLPQAVAIATAYNREYQLEKELLYTTALDLILTQHYFETNFFGAPRGMYARAAGEGFSDVGAGIVPRIHPDRLGQDLPADPCGLRGDRFDIIEGFGFNRLLTDGTRIATNVAMAWGRILTGALRGESLLSVLSVEVARPLLRGSDRRVVMENLTQAERNTLYQVRSFNRFRKTFVVSVISQYYWVLQKLDGVKNAREHHNTMQWLYNRVEKLANAGRVPRFFELNRVHQDKLNAEDAYIQAQKEYKQALDEFKIILSLPTTAEFQLNEGELEVLRAAEMTYPDFSEAEAIETALDCRLDLANSADAIIDAERKVFVAADALRAGLNIGVRTNVPLQDLTSDSKQLQDMLLAGLHLDLPLDREAEQNIYRKALITYNQRQREDEEAGDMVALEVRQAYRDLTEAAERYRVRSESLALSRKRFKATFLSLQYRRASSRRVLTSQRALFAAQNDATEALVDYSVATLNFYRDTGVLQVRPDGLWEKESAQENKTTDQGPQTKDHRPQAKVLRPES
ncbi:MAG: TolC family protein [Planctomycetota bacterium]|jgi:outer membrane protein TolC